MSLGQDNVICFYCRHLYENHRGDYGGCTIVYCECTSFVPVGVVESVDTTVSKTVVERREGSNPSLDTIPYLATLICNRHDDPIRLIACPECLIEAGVRFYAE